MKQLSTMIEVPLLIFNFSSYQSYKVKGDLLTVMRKRKTNLTTFCLLFETKVHRQENLDFLFFGFFAERKQIVFLVGSS